MHYPTPIALSPILRHAYKNSLTRPIMIIARHLQDTCIQKEINATNHAFLDEALWIDLINPTSEEEDLIEKHLALSIPTREEMREIELSSRLYRENDALFMTATMIAQAESTSPNQDSVTFVVTKNQLITIRYINPQAFSLFLSRLTKVGPIDNPASLLTELLDVTVDRIADILELINHQLEHVSKNIFHYTDTPAIDYHELLKHVGLNGELTSKIIESLLSFNRLISFFEQYALVKMKDVDHVRLHSLVKDISSLNEYSAFLSSKIGFLLEATLGMVQIDQNRIIKIFSVAAVIFLPPTLIASIYGMNFHFMPELTWKFGYMYAFVLMLISSWLPYKYFKYRKWL